MSDPVAPLPVLAYDRPAAAAVTPAVMPLALAGLAVSGIAVAFHLLVAFAVARSLADHAGGAVGMVTTVVIGAAVLFDLTLAAQLFAIAAQLIRRRPAAVGRLRRWSARCLLGVGGFVVACSADALVLRPRDPLGEPPLAVGLISGVAGCVYPLAARRLTRRPAG